MTKEELETLLQESLDNAYAQGRADGIAAVTRYTQTYADNLKSYIGRVDGIRDSIFTLKCLMEGIKSGKVS